MNESLAPSKFTSWKRPLMGSLLSGLIAGVLWSIKDLYEGYYFLGLYFPILISYLFLPKVVDEEGTIILPVIFWFIVGIVIATRSMDNKTAIKWWY